MHKPKVSVIMAVRNKEKILSEVIESILKQTFKDFEFIIVEDCSDDNTGKVVDMYAEKDKRVKVIHNESRMQRSFSRNLAIKRSSGAYIAVNDGDDISLPARLETEVKYLDSSPDCYLVAARAYLYDENGKKIGESCGNDGNLDITERLEEENKIVHSSIMFRNTKEYKYREKFVHAQDYDLFLQMVADDKRIHLVNDFLVIYSTKKDLVYDDSLIKQLYSAEIARYVLKKKKEGEDVYDTIDMSNIEKYIPQEMILDLNMKRHFFNGEFKEARSILKRMMEENNSSVLKYYYIDTFLGGWIHRVLKGIKRMFL